MPVWNGERYLREAVDSILRQTFTNFELLAVDDGSTDATLEILRSYQDSRLRVIQKRHGGIVSTLNDGLAQARSEWIARMDADDISLPSWLERLWGQVLHKPQIILCHSAISNFGEGIAIPGDARLPRSRSFTALRLCYQSPISHSGVMYKKNKALEVGGYFEHERYAEDFSLWGRLIECGDIIGLPAKLVKIRRYPQSTTQQNLEIMKALTQSIGTRHCQNFMRLDLTDACRANKILVTAPRWRALKDWSWFLSHCAPRLRWKSRETLGWLAWQTLKVLSRR
jgi:glycosyltransferase involved in cell wall biosynthesis